MQYLIQVQRCSKKLFFFYILISYRELDIIYFILFQKKILLKWCVKSVKNVKYHLISSVFIYLIKNIKLTVILT